MGIEEEISNREPSVAIHELTHGFNAGVLVWNSAGDFWFDEGTSEYTAHLANIALWSQGSGTGRIVFFDDIFQEDAPSASFADLKEYYETNASYMESWNPTDQGVTAFGYAYSELVIRAYVKKYGEDALRGTYACLADVKEATDDWRRRNEITLGCMSKAAGGADTEGMIYPGKEFAGDSEKFAEFMRGVAWSQTSPFKTSKYMNEVITKYGQAIAELGSASKLESAREDYNSALEYYVNGEYDMTMMRLQRASGLIDEAYAEEKNGGIDGIAENATSRSVNESYLEENAGICLQPQAVILLVFMLFMARKVEK
ncbi:MAG: hypothetical protein NT157_00720 [Candidatus Micrarchaeota archaeon]|nr:hypothetical protein [Candidatus Micrarchaeota archaeon]